MHGARVSEVVLDGRLRNVPEKLVVPQERLLVHLRSLVVPHRVSVRQQTLRVAGNKTGGQRGATGRQTSQRHDIRDKMVQGQ